MFYFCSDSGRFYGSDGTQLTIGYSGSKEGLNNPSLEDIQNIGPIPRGCYTIGPEYSHPVLGPCTMNLTPEPGTNTFGRSLFRIHGDNSQHDASHGCVILNKQTRQLIAQSSSRILKVI